MNNKKYFLSLIIFMLVFNTVDAQFNFKNKNDANKPKKSTNTTIRTAVDSPKSSNESPRPSSVSDIKSDSKAADTFQNLKPLENKENTPFAKTEGETIVAEQVQNAADTFNELIDKPLVQSLRSNYGFVNNVEEIDYTPDDLFPIEEQKLRHEDAVFSEILWEEIDAREKINLPFLYKAKDENGKDQRLYALLLRAILDGGITAFDAEVDDRFSTPLSSSKLRSSIKGSLDVLIGQNIIDPTKSDTSYYFNDKYAAKPDSVYIFRLKTHYIFDKKTSVFYKRILGIAPVAKIKVNNEITEKTLFWLYYPDIKTYLSKQYVYNPFNLTKKMTWEELFSARYFSSYIIKTTYENNNYEKLSTLYKDPYIRLLKSEEIKNRIYNWESDRWEY